MALVSCVTVNLVSCVTVNQVLAQDLYGVVRDRQIWERPRNEQHDVLQGLLTHDHHCVCASCVYVCVCTCMHGCMCACVLCTPNKQTSLWSKMQLRMSCVRMRCLRANMRVWALLT